MEYQIQSLILPTNKKHKSCRKLFYRGDHAILDQDKRTLTLGFAQRCDFVSYLNAVSWQKWQKYTNAKKLTLHLEVEGEVELAFLGYHKESLTVIRTDFENQTDRQNHGRREITYVFPENNEQMVGFEITALSSKATLFGGYYTVEVPKKEINDVVLSLATTTCRKEPFIKENVALLRSEIIEKNDEMAKNFYLHVIDNGQTLTERDISGKHVYLHPNINSGGSGGFARGMMETLHQKVEATHILLMDDDVLVLPESIRRTYNLLKLAKPEYHDYFISGAMLYYENPANQHEDIGTMNQYCYYRTLKRPFNHELLSENLENESFYPAHQNSYAAWWYCCIPISTVKKFGLPMPFFIRVDDMEYSLRAKAKFITMNGICVWHMGFTTKYNAAFDLYQQYRNWLISQSASEVIQDVQIIPSLWSQFRVELLRFSYNSAELIVKALEDYLKGPKYLKSLSGEDNTKEIFKLNDVFVPLKDIEGGESFHIDECMEDLPRKFIDRVLMKLTWNGHVFTPKFLERDGIVPVGYGYAMQPQKITLHTRLITVNTFNRTGVEHIRDKKRFHELLKRYRRAEKVLKKRGDIIRKEWRKSAKELTSEEFWQKYLHLV